MKPIFIFLLLVSTVFSQNCSLDVSDPESPFIVNEDLKFPQYDVNKSLSFSYTGGRVFYVVCPQGTQSPYIGEKGDHVACQSGTRVIILSNSKAVEFADIKCKPSGLSTVTKSDQKCENDGTIYEIGITAADNFVSLITICFDEVKLIPFYTKYNNLFSELSQSRDFDSNFYQKFVCNGTGCTWTDSGSVYPAINMDAVYDQQVTILQSLGVEDVGISLLKFPLTTNALMVLNGQGKSQRIEKASYYDYINAVPVWDLGDKLDNFLFRVAVSGDIGSSMYTGTLGVLTLPNKNGEQVNIYLNEGKVPVPKWIWVVLDESETIVFYYNHPKSEEGENEISKVCSEHDAIMGSNIFPCKFSSVIDSEMTDFIKNNFK